MRFPEKRLKEINNEKKKTINEETMAKMFVLLPPVLIHGFDMNTADSFSVAGGNIQHSTTVSQFKPQFFQNRPTI